MRAEKPASFQSLFSHQRVIWRFVHGNRQCRDRKKFEETLYVPLQVYRCEDSFGWTKGALKVNVVSIYLLQNISTRSCKSMQNFGIRLVTKKQIVMSDVRGTMLR